MRKKKKLKKHYIDIGKAKEIKAFFLSDFHLSRFQLNSSRKVEQQVVKFLCSIEKEVTHLFLLGDIFDFWLEYRYFIPKGWIRLLGKLAELSDKGVKIYYFYGNHDIWFKKYFTEELGVTFFRRDIILDFGTTKIVAGHGDEIGHNNIIYLAIKYFYRSALLRLLFDIVPSFISFWVCNKVSSFSKKYSSKKDNIFYGEHKEHQILFAKKYVKINPHIDYFIYGHRHFPLQVKIADKTHYINIGDWITHNSYAMFDGKKLQLKFFKSNKKNSC